VGTLRRFFCGCLIAILLIFSAAGAKALSFDDLFFLKSDPPFKETCDLSLKLTVNKVSFVTAEYHVLTDQLIHLRTHRYARLSGFPALRTDDHVMFEKVNKATGRYLFHGEKVIIVRRIAIPASSASEDRYLCHPERSDSKCNRHRVSGGAWFDDENSERTRREFGATNIGLRKNPEAEDADKYKYLVKEACILSIVYMP
jgi:hypothetical protein